MSNHTRGPWIVVQGNASPVKILARVPNAESPTEDNVIVCQTVADQREGQDPIANAHLIASSPTLLKAVKLALMEFERISYQKKADVNVIDCLKKAIAKAQGE